MGILFENWVKKKEIRGESKSQRKESLFPKEVISLSLTRSNYHYLTLATSVLPS